MTAAPRITLGIATYNRDRYLAEAIESCLSQDYPSLEVLVVLDGSTNPRIESILGDYLEDERFRVVRHPVNRGISAAYNTLVQQGCGELIAMLGDDDVCLPGRIRRQAEIFDRHPDTGVVHGDAVIIDSTGTAVGEWRNVDMTPAELVRCFYRNHDFIVDPSRMVRREVYDRVGGYDDRFKVAQDFEFWLRAARHFRFRHTGGAPLIQLRRHGENGSDESQRGAETEEVELALLEALPRYSLRELVPELDWAVIDPESARRQALERLADQVEHRGVPTPRLARHLRQRAAEFPVPPTPPRTGQRLLMTMFGWNDSGGGTILPRLIAKELVRRGWEVSVVHAATATLPGEPMYARREWVEDGVRLVGIHNRPSALLDLHDPLREIDDPVMRELFREELQSFQPDVVHFHNLHNLGASLIDEVAAYGAPSFFTTHNYWLICPRAYLLRDDGSLCSGPGDGSRCAACTGSQTPELNAQRLAALRSRVGAGVTRVLAISESVRQTLIAAGYQPDAIDVVPQSMPHEHEIWQETGNGRVPGRRGERLTVGFVGYAYANKGPQLLVEAAQRTRARVDVHLIGQVPASLAARLRAMDHRGVVDFKGGYSPSELPALLADVDVAALPSTWWDCANLAAQECHAARVPLVVPRLGGLGETVRDGIDGLTFAGLSVDDLARQLDRLDGEPGLLERLQRGIHPPVDFSAHVDELEAYYRGDHGAERRTRTQPPVQVRWKGDHGRVTSLAIINDEVTRRVDVTIQRVDRGDQALDPPLRHPADVEIRHQWPPDFQRAASGRLAAIAPWEFGAAPAQWVRDIQANVDELWVPSEYVRAMYVGSGVEPERVHVLPNGVDLDAFRPRDAPRPASDPLRFLYVGGITPRKGVDALITAWDAAFPGRDDVALVVKAALAGGAYREARSDWLRQRAAEARLPRVTLIEEDLDTEQLAELYRSSDVFVLPYRGEGFAMPVLEAMASGLPVITTAGGPTDEFCPPEAGWRIRSVRQPVPLELLRGFEPEDTPWMLEPDLEHLVTLLRAAARADDLRSRGQAGRAAAAGYSWDAVARTYEERIRSLAAMPARRADAAQSTFPLSGEVGVRVLATPAWRGRDELDRLLTAWSVTTPDTDACLYLLADPAAAGEPDVIEARVVGAAERAGVDLERCADIEILLEPFRSDRDAMLHRSVDAFVPLHPGCAGHARMARSAGRPVVAPDSALSQWLKSRITLP